MLTMVRNARSVREKERCVRATQGCRKKCTPLSAVSGPLAKIFLPLLLLSLLVQFVLVPCLISNVVAAFVVFSFKTTTF